MTLLDKYINPLTDFGFKKLFGTESNKDLLIDFLNQLMPAHHQIQDLTFEKNEQLGESEIDRIVVFDIFCKSKNGEHFIVEIQRKKQEYFKDRSILYSTYPIHQYAEKGRAYDFQLPVIYTIAILDFTFDDYQDDPNMVHHIKLKDENGKVFYDKLSYIYIELPKFKKTLEELETHFDKWLFVLKWLNKLQERPKPLQERVFKKLFKLAEIAKYNKMERAQYEQNLKQYRDLRNVVNYAKDEVRIETIKNGLAEGVPLELLSKLTKLPIDEIKRIISEKGWNTNNKND